MTEMLFRDNAYLTEAEATVLAVNDRGGIVLDRSLFYPTGGGQPGDNGALILDDREIAIATAVKGETQDEIVLVPAEGQTPPEVGAAVTQRLDWETRKRYMRVHTALHLLSVVIPLPVTGGSIGAEKGRLDFDMPDAPDDKDALEAKLNALINEDFAVTEGWITDEELLANPDLVKTMAVKPPMGQGKVRMIRIGRGPRQIDWQPCGGTHVRHTSEIGRIRLGKIEKKGKQNRRVSIHLED
jgi:misacylated tRNA(Ala) deacylase